MGSWANVCAGNTIGFWAQIKLHYVQEDWMLALVRRNECYRSRSAELDKWCTTDLFVTQVLLAD